MFASSLLQDICDSGFASGRGALALILVGIEESCQSWLDLPALQQVCEKYSYRSYISNNFISSQSAQFMSFSGLSSKSKTAKVAQRRICRNLYSGSCSQSSSSHTMGGFNYEHFCSHCATRGSKFPQPEQGCRSNGRTEGRDPKFT